MTEKLIQFLTKVDKDIAKGTLDEKTGTALLVMFTKLRAQRNLIYENWCIEGDELREMIEQGDADVLEVAMKLGVVD